MKSLKAKFASLRTRSSEQAHAAPVYETEELEQSPQSWDMGLAADEPVSCASREKLVVAHFMLGNTYNFTDSDWHTTFEQVAATNLLHDTSELIDRDGLALNLGPEPWQLSQAHSALRILSTFQTHLSRHLRVFVNLDMNVLPCTSQEEADEVKGKVSGLMRLAEQLEQQIASESSEGGEREECKAEGEHRRGDEVYLKWEGRRVVGTFSGHAAVLGGKGWEGWVKSVEEDLGEEICFWPTFFLPPSNFASLVYTRGLATWNSAWPLSSPSPSSLSLRCTDPLLFSPLSSIVHGRGKGYMTAISPCFFTHYAKPGSTPSGEWEWGKNWVYGMDDLGVVRRWEKFIDLAQSGQQGGQAGDEAGCGKGLGVGPDIVQIVSWNDCGESHYICPTILGCQPGSEGWVDGMPHAALGEVCAWMAGRWRDGDGEVDSLYRGKAGGQAQTAGGVYDEVEAAPQGDVGIQEPESRLGHTGKVWMWYRIHSAKMDAADDERGRPEHTDRAKDLINVVVLLPRIASTLGTGAGDCDSLLSSGGSPEHSGTGDLELVLNNAEYEHVEPLVRGKANLFTIPFVPGPVRISIRNTDHANNGEAIWEAEGRGIDAVVDKWNYNFWSGSWDVDV